MPDTPRVIHLRPFLNAYRHAVQMIGEEFSGFEPQEVRQAARHYAQVTVVCQDTSRDYDPLCVACSGRCHRPPKPFCRSTAL